MASPLDLQEQEQLDDLKAFWKTYGNLITWVLVIALGAFAAWSYWKGHQREQGFKAGAMFDELERAAQAGDVDKTTRIFRRRARLECHRGAQPIDFVGWHEGGKDMFQSLTISDYLFTKCLLFAKVTLPDDEFRLYQRLFEIIHQQLVQPDLLIYLHAPVNKLQANIKKRNRSYEQNIPDDYLFNIQETYTHYIKQHNIKTLYIDTGNADFLGNEKHLQAIYDALENEYEEGQHYLSLP